MACRSHLDRLDPVVLPVPDVHVGPRLVALLHLLLLLLDTEEDALPFLAPLGRAELAQDEALGEGGVGGGIVCDNTTTAARGATAGRVNGRIGQQDVLALDHSFALLPPEHRQSRPLFIPHHLGVQVPPSAERGDAPAAHLHQVETVPHLVLGVHQIGQHRPGVVEGVLGHIPHIRHRAGGEIPEDQVGASGLVIVVAQSAAARTTAATSRSTSARRSGGGSTSPVRPGLLNRQPAGVLGKGDGRGVLHLEPLFGPDVEEVKRSGHRLPLLPEFIRLLLRRCGEEGQPPRVLGEHGSRSVGAHLHGALPQILQIPHEEGAVPIVGLVGEGHPTTVRGERHLRDPGPLSVILQVEHLQLLGRHVPGHDGEEDEEKCREEGDRCRSRPGARHD